MFRLAGWVYYALQIFFCNFCVCYFSLFHTGGGIPNGTASKLQSDFICQPLQSHAYEYNTKSDDFCIQVVQSVMKQDPLGGKYNCVFLSWKNALITYTTV